MAVEISNVTVTDNSAEVKAELKRRIAQGLVAIGGQMEKHAKENCPVDTGRLRNSITFATKTAQGNPNTDQRHKAGATPQDAKPEDYKMRTKPDEDTVVIGTNVEYAEVQEFFGKKGHFLKNAAANHNEEYKKILKAALKD